MINLSRKNIGYQCFSLDKDQYEVIEHTKGAVLKEKRNMLQESGRIARGNVRNVLDLDVNKYDVRK